ncbi:MAG: YbaN family protein [Hyphomicrobiaceae bacterium]
MTKAMTRAFWFGLGAVSLALAVAGVVLPLLPTTPFLLLAAFSFARSSARVHDWLLNHAVLGPPIRDWRRDGAIRRKAKVVAVGTIVATFLISVALGLGAKVLAIQAVVLTCVCVFICTRPEPGAKRLPSLNATED